ncbi:up-regulator of cell proliferation-like [Cololabis saira]|uniref:up-regulator of cell proliferation-like n=1 Tax=Cololabis saira TaxID=129043 RepID=UPI002AD3C500|nr:up-regulator of cell proliferation-like [Cololabis saira]
MKLRPPESSGYQTDVSSVSRDCFRQDQQHAEVMCDLCSQAGALKNCRTCNNYFCESDALKHHGEMPKHVLTDVSEEVEGRCCPHSRPLEFFCMTDEVPICRICVKGNHKRHEIIYQNMQRQMSGDEDFEQPRAVVPPPGGIHFLSVKPTSVVLSWEIPQELQGPKRFRIKWSSVLEVEGSLPIRDLSKVEINNLQLGQQYFFSVATEDEEGNLSKWVTDRVSTAVPPPRHLTKGHSESTALFLQWSKGENMEGIPHQFLITITSPGKEARAISTRDCYKRLSDLEPDTEYTISVSTVLNDKWSDPVSTTIHTEPCLREVLSKLGLEDQYDCKLTISDVLEINKNDTSQNKLEMPKSLPMAFLKSLFMLKANARSVKCVSCAFDTDKKMSINPLDLITALFLCSDSFLQQDMVLKMTLCQFAVPLLLPNSETREVTMLLWPMREIVQSFRPSQHAFMKQSCEERLVLSDIPLISFVRLGKTCLSKSQILNKLLSNTEHYHDRFYHSDLVCGDVPRRISDGLVEISWYLPCGNRNVDKFSEPLTIANLRGDIRAFDKQFSFLCQTSSAVYIFCDESESDYFTSLQGKYLKAKITLVSSKKGKTFRLKTMTVTPSLKITNETHNKKTDVELVKVLQDSVSKFLQSKPKEVSLANLPERARCCEIAVDEDTDECQNARKNVYKITPHIAETSGFKDIMLPCQGQTWKELSWVETEYWRLRKVGNQNIEEYRMSLITKEKELRRKQQRFAVTPMMSRFLDGVCTAEAQRYYYLKWLEMELEDLSRHQLSALRGLYKELTHKSPQETEEIAEVGKQISACSLQVRHFLRECGQSYASATGLPEFCSARKTLEQLPGLCAQMLLDGFPLELVDGDAANIPMKWIADVLTELHYIKQSNSKLKVITIIGAESSGKSTLLNTMFGIRFPISKEICSKGAFIQLVGVSEDVRRELGCDCIAVIDTEGLKPHQMPQDDHSHERDMQVASLAVALSDITIVSFTETDIVEMVVQAFARLGDVNKKPLCHFVHVHMFEMCAGDRKRRDEEMIKQFNVLIQSDPQMKRGNIKTLSDLMELKSDTWTWYIPPVWKGTPPMASFSIDYSEAVQELKKQLISDLKKCPERSNLMDFVKRIENIWKAL